MQGTKTWDHQLLSTTFSHQAVQIIEETTVVLSDHEDILRWTPAIDGRCTTKATYKYLATQVSHILPTQGPRSINSDANSILHKVWKSKTIPPLLKTFAWRLIRRALATGERVGRYSSHIDQHCSYCGNIENDIHLFFHCDLSKQVWSTATPPMSTNIIVADEDGVQHLTTLQTLPYAKRYLLFATFGKPAMITASKEKHGLHFRYIRRRQHICSPTLRPSLHRQHLMSKAKHSYKFKI